MLRSTCRLHWQCSAFPWLPGSKPETHMQGREACCATYNCAGRSRYCCYCGLCCLGVPLSAKQTIWKWRDNNVCMLIHSRRHISHMRVLSWHKQLYSYQGWFTWQLDLARFMWPVPGVQLWVDLKDASVKTDLFWCLVNIAALLCGCFVCCLDFLYLCMSYDSGIWVRRTKTSVNINISSAVLYFWSVLTALSVSIISYHQLVRPGPS